ncbi:hypothetical protein, partial [Mesorhizobium sp.]
MWRPSLSSFSPGHRWAPRPPVCSPSGVLERRT